MDDIVKCDSELFSGNDNNVTGKAFISDSSVNVFTQNDTTVCNCS